MTIKTWLIGAAGGLALGVIGSSAQAAPLGGVQLDRADARNSAVQDVVWVRRCRWHRGHRVCRRVWRDYGYYDDYYGYPYGYAPYAYGPSLGFFFGGGHHGGHGFGGHGGGGHHGGGHR